MSDDSEKPFEPTPQRIAKAKREGNVPRAGEFGANLSFAAAIAACGAAVPCITAAAAGAVESAARGGVPWSGLAIIVAAGSAPVAAAALAGTLAAALQNGGLAAVAVSVKLERLNPVEGCKRILSRDTLGHTLRALAAVVLVVAAMTPAIVAGAVEMSLAANIAGAASAAWRAARTAATCACGVGVLFAVAEYAFARRSWLQRLRMSFEERRRETREQEGDPSERGRRRALHRSLLRGRLSEVERASFVVVNPVHVAVALEYRPPAVQVPRVLVLAAEAMALRVRALAAAHGVPVVESAALARALYRDGRAGAAIAPLHFVAVAEVVAGLMRAGDLAP